MYNLNVYSIPRKYFIIEYQLKDLSNIEYFKNIIDKNTGEYDYVTNVKGRMTSFKQFVKDKIFFTVMDEVKDLFDVMNYGELYLKDAWGNILQNKDSVEEHAHECTVSGILYLTEGGPGTYFKEANKLIEEKIGKVVLFSPDLMHSVKQSDTPSKRYTLAFNFEKVHKW